MIRRHEQRPPYRAPLLTGTLAVLSLLASAPSAACVYVHVSRLPDTRARIADSFLYRSAEIFYPGGAPADPVALPDLTPAHLQILERSIKADLEDLWKVQAQQAGLLSRTLGRPISRRVRPTLRIPHDKNSPQAGIAARGTLILDAKIVQAIFRASIVHAFEGDILLERIETESPNAIRSIGSVGDQRIALQTFFDVKRRIDSGARIGLFGDFVDDDRGSPGQSADGLFPVNWAGKNLDAEAFYRYQILFLLAHELGHLALAHYDAIKVDDSCEVSRQRETDADVFAITLIATGTASSATADMLGMFARAKVSSGFADFLRLAYAYSEFGLPGDAACRYPSPEARVKTMTPVYDGIRLKQISEWIRIRSK